MTVHATLVAGFLGGIGALGESAVGVAAGLGFVL